MRITFAKVCPFIAALLMGALYLAFTDNVGWRELIASALTGVLSAAAAVVVAHAGNMRFAFRARDVAQAIYIPWNALAGCLEIFRAMVKQLFTRAGAASALAEVPFDMGQRDDPYDAGRRALAITYTTATPNFIIFGLVDDPGLMLYHQITPGPIGSMTQNLGARP